MLKIEAFFCSFKPGLPGNAGRTSLRNKYTTKFLRLSDPPHTEYRTHSQSSGDIWRSICRSLQNCGLTDLKTANPGGGGLHPLKRSPQGCRAFAAGGARSAAPLRNGKFDSLHVSCRKHLCYALCWRTNPHAKICKQTMFLHLPKPNAGCLFRKHKFNWASPSACC